MNKQPDFEAFARHIMKDWPEGYDIDGMDLQEMAIKHGILVEIEGGFDPEKHDCPYGSEKGDPWYQLVWHKEPDEDASE